MIDRHLAAAVLAASLGLWATAGQAHTPLFSCYDNGDGTILCEGGFSDGSSAAGVKITILAGGTTVMAGALDKNSEFQFAAPNGAYTVQFDAGPGHVLEVDSGDIQ